MTSNVLLISFIAIAIVAIVILIIKFPKFQKYGKYALIILPGIVLLAWAIFKPKKKDDTAVESTEFKAQLNEIKASIHEVNTVAELKAKYVKEENKEKLEELQTVTKTTDKAKRRKKLADMIG